MNEREQPKPVAYVPRCHKDSYYSVEGEFAWNEQRETPFEVADPEHWECCALYVAYPTPQADKVPAAEGASDFYNGICVALAVIYAFDQETCWREVVKAAGNRLLQYAAYVDPEEWELAGFAHYEFDKPERAAPPAKLPQDAQPVGWYEIFEDGQRGTPAWGDPGLQARVIEKDGSKVGYIYAAPQPARAGAVELSGEWAADVLGIPTDKLPVSEFSEHQRERIACVLKGARAIAAATTAATGGKEKS